MAIKQGKLTELSEQTHKKERFIRARMWFSTIMSYFFQDRGVIPENIGNNILIGNNVFVTKYFMTKMIVISDFSLKTPIAFTSKLIHSVKGKVKGLTIDFTIKGNEYHPNLGSGLGSRLSQWERTLDNEDASDGSKERAARLIFTRDLAVKHKKMLRARIYIMVRASNGAVLRMGMKEVKAYLDDHDIDYKEIKSDMETYLKYTAMLSNQHSKHISDTPTNILSSLTAAEILPSTQGLNDNGGTFMGMNRKNHQPYFIDFKKSSNGKTILVCGLSGFGKTFIVLNWGLDWYNTGYNMTIMDIKGNEFTAFTKAANGVILSFRPDSTRYVNTFRLDAKRVDGDPVGYFDEMFKMSKQQLIILGQLSESQRAHGEAFIEQFLQSVYTQLGVIKENPNTWSRSSTLNPYSIYEFFLAYLSNDIRRQYGDVVETFASRFKIYLSKAGSCAHIFREEYSLEDILANKVITFDFGILNSNRVQDEAVFKLRILYMNFINNEFGRYKKSLGEWTVNICEETQIAADFVLQTYAERVTLGRAQNQITVLLGNSITTLASNPVSKAIIDNINILCIGLVHKSSRDYLVNEFGLEKYIESLKKLCDETGFDNTFLLVNKMQRDGAPAWLRAYVPDKVASGKLFKTVDVESDE